MSSDKYLELYSLCRTVRQLPGRVYENKWCFPIKCSHNKSIHHSPLSLPGYIFTPASRVSHPDDPFMQSCDCIHPKREVSSSETTLSEKWHLKNSTAASFKTVSLLLRIITATPVAGFHEASVYMWTIYVAVEFLKCHRSDAAGARWWNVTHSLIRVRRAGPLRSSGKRFQGHRFKHMYPCVHIRLVNGWWHVSQAALLQAERL